MTPEERRQAVNDILITAVESSYEWFTFSHYNWSDNDADPTKPVRVRVKPSYNDHGTDALPAFFNVEGTSYKWGKAIKMAAERYGQSFDRFLEDHDANGADLAMQYLVFGKEVYA